MILQYWVVFEADDYPMRQTSEECSVRLNLKNCLWFSFALVLKSDAMEWLWCTYPDNPVLYPNIIIIIII